MAEAKSKTVATIHERMVAILDELPPIGKDQKNVQQNFMFRGHDDVMNALNPLLAQHGVFVVPDVLERVTGQRTTAKGSIMFEVNLHVRYTFHGAGGDSITASVWGEGTDMGDKATNKAMTMAFKNVLNQAFAISNEEMRDTDADTPEHSASRGEYLPETRVEPQARRPESWAALAAAFNMLEVDPEWLKQAIVAQFGKDRAELDSAEKDQAFQLLAGVLMRLQDGEHGEPEMFGYSRAQLQDAFAQGTAGIVLEGPPWAIGMEKPENSGRMSKAAWLEAQSVTVPGEDPSIEMEGPSQ